MAKKTVPAAVKKADKATPATTTATKKTATPKKEKAEKVATKKAAPKKETPKKSAAVKKEKLPTALPVQPDIVETETAEIFKIDPRNIDFDNKVNPREEYGDIKSLAAFIKENGAESLPPIKVRKASKKSDFEFELVHGYRRMNAITSLSDKGTFTGQIHAVLVAKNYTREDELMDHITDNEGLNLSPFEQAFIYKALKDTGMKEKEIRIRTGKSKNHITWAIRLAEAPTSIHEAIKSGLISTTLAKDFIWKFKGEAEAKLIVAIKAMEKLGAEKVTTEVAKEVGLGRPHAFISKLNKLEEIEMEKPLLAKVELAKSIIEAVNTIAHGEDLINKLNELL